MQEISSGIQNIKQKEGEIIKIQTKKKYFKIKNTNLFYYLGKSVHTYSEYLIPKNGQVQNIFYLHAT